MRTAALVYDAAHAFGSKGLIGACSTDLHSSKVSRQTRRDCLNGDLRDHKDFQLEPVSLHLPAAHGPDIFHAAALNLDEKTYRRR